MFNGQRWRNLFRPNGFSSTAQNPCRSSVTTSDAGVYSLTVSLTTGCSASATVSVGVNTATATASSNSPVCTGTIINLSSTGGGLYSWPAGFSSTAENPTRSNVTTAMEGSYTVTITNASGCTATASTFVDVNGVNGGAGSNSPVCVWDKPFNSVRVGGLATVGHTLAVITAAHKTPPEPM
ncbi:MAG: hypothetical protein U0Y10_02135 [Spirosomataceae bacterium]